MDLDEELYDNFHNQMATDLMCCLPSATYGRAAKIIAIYIKTVYVIRFPDSNISRFAHPPIDRILLTAIAAHKFEGLRFLDKGWTQFDENDYKSVISNLRNLKKQKSLQAFWEIECFWNPTPKKKDNC